MAMVDMDDSCQFSAGGLAAQVDWLGLRVGGHPALSPHSSDEPGELSQSLWSYISATADTCSKEYSTGGKSDDGVVCVCERV